MSADQGEAQSLKRKRTQRSRTGIDAASKRRKAEEETESLGQSQSSPVTGKTVPEGRRSSHAEGSETANVTAKSAAQPSVAAKSALQRTQTKSHDDDFRNKGWTLSKVAGGKRIRKDPKFSSDGQYLFAAKEDTLEVLSVDDSTRFRTMAYAGKTTIRAFAASRVNPDKVYVATANPDKVDSWDLEDETGPTQSEEVEGEVVQLAIGRAAQQDEELVYTLLRSKGYSAVVCNSKTIFKTKTQLHDFIITGEALIAIGNTKLVAWKLQQNDTPSHVVEWDIGHNITSFGVRKAGGAAGKKAKAALVEPKLSIAVGTLTGEIFLYDDVVVASKPSSSALPSPVLLHWHREAVGSVKWSRDGLYLISGGMESTLVLWQLVTGKKQYLPHLGADIDAITVSLSGTSYAVQLADNSIVVLSTSELEPIAHCPDLQRQLPLDQTLVSMNERSSSANKLETHSLRLVGGFHPVHKDQLHIAVPTTIGGLAAKLGRSFVQSFDIASGHHLSRQALTRNMITDLFATPDGKRIEEPDVYLMKISFDGTIMATIESWQPPTDDYKYLSQDTPTSREQANQHRETYLKFWQWNEDKACWALQNRITNPHPSAGVPGRVLDLVADPTSLRFFTVGDDSVVRSWTPRRPERAVSVGEVQEWSSKVQLHLPSSDAIVAATGSYSGCLAVSPDASILACSVNSHDVSSSNIHLLTTSPLQTMATLPPVSGQLHSISFSTRTLCALTTETLMQFDVPTLRPLTTVAVSSLKQSTPLATRYRPLAVSTSNPSLAAIATPAFRLSADPSQPHTLVEVIDLSRIRKQVRYRATLPGIVTAIFPDPRLRAAFIVITADSAVLRLTGPREDGTPTAAPRQTVADLPSRITAAAPAKTADVAMEDASPEPETLVGEKRVVRPEQLARLFEGTAAGAMPVRSMFEGVMALFAPRVSVA